MHAAITATITLLGIAIGALSAYGTGLASQIVMGCTGAMFSLPIGAGVAGLVGLI